MADTPGAGPAPTLSRRSQTAQSVLEALVESGIPALVVLVSLLYAPLFSDYMLPKQAAVQAMVPLLLCLWGARMAVRRRLQIEASPVYAPALIYLGISLASLAAAHNRLQGAEVLLTQVWMLAFYVLVTHSFQDRQAITGVMWTVALVGGLVSLVGLLQHAGVHPIPIPRTSGNLPISTLGNPNFVAHYLDLIIPLSAGLLMVRRRAWERILLGLILAATIVHLLVTQSRAGWLASGLALGFLLVMRHGLGVRVRTAVLGLLAILLLSAPAGMVLRGLPLPNGGTLGAHVRATVDQVSARARSLLNPDDFSISQRRVVWADTVALIAAHPWLGVGPGNYELVLPLHRTVARHRAWQRLMGQRTDVAYHAHNDYLETAAEIGIPGGVAYLAVLAAVLWRGWFFVRHPRGPEERALTLACLAGLVATLLHCLFSFNLQDPTAALHFWLLAGLTVAINRRQDDGCPPRMLVDVPLGPATIAPAALVAVGALAIGAYCGLSTVMGDYYYSRGLDWQQVGMPNRAILAFRSATEWRGHDFRYWHMLGAANLREGRVSQAERALARCVDLHPNEVPALRLLGQARYGLGRAEEAIAVLRRAVALAPLDSESYEWLALAYRRAGRREQAAGTWRQALGFRPEDAGLLNSLAVDLVGMGERDQAVAVLEHGAQLHPGDAQILVNLAQLHLSAGRAAEAERVLRAAVDADPQRTETRALLARLYVEQGRGLKALEQVNAALLTAPQDEALLRLAGAAGRLLQGERR